MTSEAQFMVRGIPGHLSGVLFDLDDTLIDRRTAFHSWATTYIDHLLGPGATREELNDAINYLVSLDNDGFTARLDFFSALKRRHKDINASREELVSNYYRDILPHIRLMEGASSFLEVLSRMGIPFGIVTNGGPHQMDKARAANLTETAVCIVVSQDFGPSKPDSAIFLAGAERLGVPPSDILFVGDQPVIDVAGAHASGMRTVWLRNGRTWPIGVPDNSCDVMVDSLTELTLDEVQV